MSLSGSSPFTVSNYILSDLLYRLNIIKRIFALSSQIKVITFKNIS